MIDRTRNILIKLTAALMFVALVGATAHAGQSFGTSWDGLHKHSKGFGVDVDAGATLAAGAPVKESFTIARDQTCPQFDAATAAWCYDHYTKLIEDFAYINYRTAVAEIDAAVTLFGHKRELLYAGLGAGQQNGALYAHYSVRVAGIEVRGARAESKVGAVAVMPVYGTKFSKEIDIGPFSVEAEVGAGGYLFATFEAEAKSTGLKATFTPGINTSAWGSVGFDVAFASAGIETELTLFSLSTPVTGTLKFNSDSSFTAGYGLSGDYTALSGSLGVYGSLFGVSGSVSLIDIDGLSGRVNLANGSTTFSL